jgi:hypothetical protein
MLQNKNVMSSYAFQLQPREREIARALVVAPLPLETLHEAGFAHAWLDDPNPPPKLEKPCHGARFYRFPDRQEGSDAPRSDD